MDFGASHERLSAFLNNFQHRARKKMENYANFGASENYKSLKSYTFFSTFLLVMFFNISIHFSPILAPTWLQFESMLGEKSILERLHSVWKAFEASPGRRETC